MAERGAAVNDLGDMGDLSHLEIWQLKALQRMLRFPSAYTQRVVETLSFIESGCQHWRRDIQLRLPNVAAPNIEPGQVQTFIVSLGMFKRRRFPDFSVRDADGRRLPLLTRHQHGYCLATAMVRRFIPEASEWEALSRAADGPGALDELYAALVQMLTSVTHDTDPKSNDVDEALRRVLRCLPEVPLSRVDAAANLLAEAYDQMAYQTQYLCWVTGVPGSVVTLHVEYTMADAPRLEAGDRHVDLPTSYRTSSKVLRAIYERHVRFRRLRVRTYARVGLSPLYYVVRSPSNDHTGSYYFTVRPPADSRVILLDWGADRCWDRTSREVDSGYPTCHVHNGEGNFARTAVRPFISLFVRADTADHGRLSAVALLSLALAFIAQRGHFLGDVSDEAQWLLAAPAAVILFIGWQRRHHYGPQMRSLRYVLWVYVAILAAFAVSVSFAPVDVGEALATDGFWEDAISGTLALASLALLTGLFASGPIYERSTRRAFARAYGRVRIYPDSWSRAGRLRRYPWQWPSIREKHARLDAAKAKPQTFPSGAALFAYVCRAYTDRWVALTLAMLIGLILSVGDDWGDGRAQCARTAQRAAEGTEPPPTGRCSARVLSATPAVATSTGRR